MLIKITLQIIILTFSASIVNAQYFESVEKEAERILISLSDGDSINSSILTELKNILSSEIGTEESESFPSMNQKTIDSLKNHLNEFESESQNISADSACVLFNDGIFTSRIFSTNTQKKNSFHHTNKKYYSSVLQCPAIAH
jgi:hypothetical protein